MTSWDTTDPARALDDHVHSYFAGHRVESMTWDTGPIDARVPGFRVHAVAPSTSASGSGTP
jgi:hypothetical protein